MTGIPRLGELSALAAALSWSLAVILFRRTGERVSAFALNLFKCALALILFGATLFLFRQFPERPIAARDWVLLAASGALGIGLSDTLLLMTLNRVGATLQAIVATSYSPSIILLSVLFLGERLTLVQGAGVLVILAAVFSVSLAGGPGGGREGAVPRRQLVAGILLGLTATAAQAVSIVMVKPLLEELPLIWANCWRLLGGLAAMVLVLPLVPARMRRLSTLADRRVWPMMIGASVLGTYVSLLFWLGGMKYTQASIASVINQTSTLWTFALAALLLKEPVTARRVVALALGVAGVAMATFG